MRGYFKWRRVIAPDGKVHDKCTFCDIHLRCEGITVDSLQFHLPSIRSPVLYEMFRALPKSFCPIQPIVSSSFNLIKVDRNEMICSKCGFVGDESSCCIPAIHFRQLLCLECGSWLKGFKDQYGHTPEDTDWVEDLKN